MYSRRFLVGSLIFLSFLSIEGWTQDVVKSRGGDVGLACDLVNLSAVSPSIILDIRYATDNNFMGFPLYPKAVCYLRGEVAEAFAGRGVPDDGAVVLAAAQQQRGVARAPCERQHALLVAAQHAFRRAGCAQTHRVGSGCGCGQGRGLRVTARG